MESAEDVFYRQLMVGSLYISVFFRFFINFPMLSKVNSLFFFLRISFVSDCVAYLFPDEYQCSQGNEASAQEDLRRCGFF